MKSIDYQAVQVGTFGGGLYHRPTKQLLPFVFRTYMEADVFRGDAQLGELNVFPGMGFDTLRDMVSAWRAGRGEIKSGGPPADANDGGSGFIARPATTLGPTRESGGTGLDQLPNATRVPRLRPNTGEVYTSPWPAEVSNGIVAGTLESPRPPARILDDPRITPAVERLDFETPATLLPRRQEGVAGDQTANGEWRPLPVLSLVHDEFGDDASRSSKD